MSAGVDGESANLHNLPLTYTRKRGKNTHSSLQKQGSKVKILHVKTIKKRKKKKKTQKLVAISEAKEYGRK